eukprot:4782614-Lingulodinium_polyedra.AAC.1
MVWVFVQEVLVALAATGFTRVPDDLKSRLEATFSTPSTAVVENGFRAMRKVETADQYNKTVTSSRKWWAPIDQKVLTERHGYEEVSWRSLRLAPGDPQVLPDKVFQPPRAKGQTTMDFRGIVSPKAS